jgi:acid phosphatase type 7
MTEARSAAIAMKAVAARAAVVAVCLFAVQCGQAPTTPTPTPRPTPTVPDPNQGPSVPIPSAPVLFSGAGDIGSCDPGSNPDGTARLLENLGGKIFTTGDNAYGANNGTARDFQDCYQPTWGRTAIKDRTFPTPGNHDYGDDTRTEANAYFNYFGGNAGPAGLGWYSFDYGDWHIISLNSNFSSGRNGGGGGPNVGVGPGSAQMAWLTGDLQANRARCTLAYWHHPLFSSGRNGSSTLMRSIFKALYDANADLVVNGHDHMYERFAPQDPDGRPDNARGIRQIIVGTGGHPMMSPVMNRMPNSERVVTNQFGILKLTLNADSYSWEFVTVGGGVQDASSGPVACH